MKDILFGKIVRIKSIALELQDDHPDISKALLEVHKLVSDPTTHLDMIPRESLDIESKALNKKLVKTTGINREFIKTFISNSIKKDKELIKKKLNNFKTDTVEEMLQVSACFKIIRKIISGMSAESYIKEK